MVEPKRFLHSFFSSPERGGGYSMSQSRPLRGIALCCIAVLLFASLDSISKYLTPYHSAIVVIWARFTVTTVLLGSWLLPRQGWRIFHCNCPGLQLLRAFGLLGAGVLFISGTRYLPLGEATAVLFIAPLLVTLLSSQILGERASAGQWLAVGAGFIGVLIIVRPGGGLLTPGMLLPVGAALCFTLYQLITRRIGTRDTVTTSNMISGAVGVVSMSVLVPFFWTDVPAPLHLAAMFTQGTIATAGHLLLTQAYRFTSPMVLAPFSYLQILFAGLFGALFFNHVPDAGALLGMGVIAFSGLGSWLSHRYARKTLPVL